MLACFNQSLHIKLEVNRLVTSSPKNPHHFYYTYVPFSFCKVMTRIFKHLSTQSVWSCSVTFRGQFYMYSYHMLSQCNRYKRECIKYAITYTL